MQTRADGSGRGSEYRDLPERALGSQAGAAFASLTEWGRNGRGEVQVP